MTQFLILHGPNLNLLGTREPDVYGRMTLEELNAEVLAFAETLGVRVSCKQSNHEGVLLDELHASRGRFQGIVFNPGAYTHTSYALRDAVAGIGIPVVEVHLSDIHSREEFRKISLIRDVCISQISGKGIDSYKEGVQLLANHLKEG